MDKNKNNRGLFFLNFAKTPYHSNYIFYVIIVLVLLILAIALIWKQNFSNQKPSRPVNLTTSSIPPPVTQQDALTTAAMQLSDTQQDLKKIHKRLKVLEKKIEYSAVKLPHELMTLELLKGTLEGYISLEGLKTSLKQNTHPWAQNLFSSLIPIKECKTYEQLASLLIIASPPVSSFSWQALKQKIQSIISIQKIDTKENETDPLNEIGYAIKSHDIQKALTSFEKLSSDQKTQLSQWKKLAEDRLALELHMKKLLIELSKG